MVNYILLVILVTLAPEEEFSFSWYSIREIKWEGYPSLLSKLKICETNLEEFTARNFSVQMFCKNIYLNYAF